MPYLYGIADTKFLFHKNQPKPKSSTTERIVHPIKFSRHPIIAKRPKFDHNEWPIQFRVSPAPLVELCCNVVDKLPMPSIYKWTDKDIRLWINRYGYPQYMVSPSCSLTYTKLAICL